MIKWSELTTEERDRLMHEKVMGKDPDALCSGRAYFEEGGRYWHCATCHRDWLTEPDEQHKDAIPYYSTDMNAAWQVVEKMRQSDITDVDQIIFDAILCNIDDWWKLEREQFCEAINLAALRAVGVEIEQ